MARGSRNYVIALFALVIIAAYLLTGCTRYAKEEQLTAMDETEASAISAEKSVVDKEQEKAALEQKLAEKQDELKQVQAEKEKGQSRL